ncbi:MAG: transcriptional regulator domain-containing protein [Thiobacillus sp.]
MDDDVYVYCAALTRDQWAWEFLRRNPDYRRDYQAFITIWRALEADYGAPPNRDFSKWKQDPRAYGPLQGEAELATPGSELCTVDDDRVLLECWMGAKWGFHKFPLDPARTAPAADELSWRPPPQPATPADDVYRLDISFDLSLPLPPQLEAAKFRLVSRAAELRRQGFAAPKTVANQRARWTAMLRLLDGDAAPDAGSTELLDEARVLVAGGYRDILRLADGGTDAK